MDLYDARLITPAKLFWACGISEKCGAKVLGRLESERAISPFRTSTGRKVLTIREAETVVSALEQQSRPSQHQAA